MNKAKYKNGRNCLIGKMKGRQYNIMCFRREHCKLKGHYHCSFNDFRTKPSDVIATSNKIFKA